MRRQSLVVSRIVAAASIIVLAHAPTIEGQIRKAGPEFQVNSYSTYLQGQPRVETRGHDSFLVVWLGSNPTPEEHYGIRGQLFDRDHGPVGGEFLVSEAGTGDENAEQYPAIARSGNNGFVVAWESYYSSDNSGIGSQRLDATGALIGSGVTVNTSPQAQKRPSVAADRDGNFVVAWINKPDLENYAPRVRIRSFMANGTPVTPEQSLDFHDHHSRDVNVAMRRDGTSVVVWQEDGAGIVGQQFDSAGNAVGAILRVAPSGDRHPDIASTSSGNFVVVWQTYAGDGHGYDVFGRRFHRDGTAASDEFPVNTYRQDQQTLPSVAITEAGNFVVVWSSYPVGDAPGQDGSGRGVFGQYFNVNGEPSGREFQANTFIEGNQGNRRVRESDVAIWPDGDFVATWTSPGQDGDSNGVFAQLFEYDSSLGPLCGDVANEDLIIRSRDALAVLHGTLGLGPCELCLCDADGSGSITTTDALSFLRLSVGLSAVAVCPPCAVNTNSGGAAVPKS